MGEFTVRRATEADIPGIFEFHKTHHPDNPRLLDQQRWHWEYNSHANASENPAYFIIDSGGTVEGTLGYIPLTFVVDGRRVEGVYPVDYYVNPQYKGLPALRLMKANMALRPITIESNYSADAERLLNGLNFAELGSSISDYFLPLRRGKTDNERTIPGVIKQLAKSAYRHTARTTAIIVNKATSHRLSVEITDRFDEDLVPQSDDTQSPVHIEKTTEHVRWWYADRPGLELTYVSVLVDKSSTALFILYADDSTNSLRVIDFLGQAPSATIRFAGMSSIIELAHINKMSSISISCADTRLGATLRTLGFSSSPGTLGLRAFCRDPDISKHLSDPSGWRFYSGDSDAI